MDELPELTEADKRALDELDMTPILGPPEERLKRAVLFAVDRMREKNRLQAEIEQLKDANARALAKVDGVDYREGHFRDNTTPDELRDIILGLALTIERLKAERDVLRTTLRRDEDRLKQWELRAREALSDMMRVVEERDEARNAARWLRDWVYESQWTHFTDEDMDYLKDYPWLKEESSDE